MAIAHVQDRGQYSGASSSVTVHLTTNTTATNTLLAAFCLPSGGSVVSVNDTISGRWIQHANSAPPYPTGSTSASEASVTADSAVTLPLLINNPQSALVVANSAVTFPLTITAGSNDEFVWTPASTSIPETFTIPPATYANITDLYSSGLGPAIGSTSGNPFDSYAGIFGQWSGNTLYILAFNNGTADNGDKISYGVHNACVDLGFTGNPNTLSGGVDGNDTFVFAGTPDGLAAPETFTFNGGGTFTTLAALATAMAGALGSVSGEPFSTYVTVSDDGSKLVLTMADGSGAAGNGNTISFGSPDAAADLGFTGNPDIFSGGEDDGGPASGLGPGGAVEVWGSRGIQGGNASVTAVFSTASVGCNVSEWSGLPFMSIMDSWSQNLGTGTTITPQTVSPRTTGDLVFVAANGSASVSAPAGYTSLSIPGDMSYSAGYQILSGSVVTATHFNQAAASMWSCVEAAFLPANASGGPWAWNTNVGFNPLSQFPECLVQMSTAQNYLASFQGVGIWTDVSPYVQSMTLGPIGRQHELDRVQATSGQLVMNGRDGSLNPWNTQSFLYPGGLDPQTPIKCTASWNGQTSPIAYLYAQSFDPNIIDAVNSTVTISAYDVLQTLSLGYLSNNNYAQAVLAGN